MAEDAGGQGGRRRSGETSSLEQGAPTVERRAWTDCFFFSSRRRHTRFDCDWSSDVCSSDLLRRKPRLRRRPSRKARTRPTPAAHPATWFRRRRPGCWGCSAYPSSTSSLADEGEDRKSVV